MRWYPIPGLDPECILGTCACERTDPKEWPLLDQDLTGWYRAIAKRVLAKHTRLREQRDALVRLGGAVHLWPGPVAPAERAMWLLARRFGFQVLFLTYPGTAYAEPQEPHGSDESRNLAEYMCAHCNELHRESWDEQWREYNQSQR